MLLFQYVQSIEQTKSYAFICYINTISIHFAGCVHPTDCWILLDCLGMLLKSNEMRTDSRSSSTGCLFQHTMDESQAISEDTDFLAESAS